VPITKPAQIKYKTVKKQNKCAVKQYKRSTGAEILYLTEC
jgi:hypothetical protein